MEARGVPMRRSQPLLLSQGHDVSMCVLLTRAAERMIERLGRTLMVGTLVSRKSRSAKR